MVSANDFHAKALAAKPNQEIKAANFWVGILHTDKLPSDLIQEGDFLWIKCSRASEFGRKTSCLLALRKTKIAKIKDNYKPREQTDEMIFLRHHDAILADTIMIDQLNSHGDRLVALEAIKKSDFNARNSTATREPLKPVFGQPLLNVKLSDREPVKYTPPSLVPGDENISALVNPVQAEKEIPTSETVLPPVLTHLGQLPTNLEDLVNTCALYVFVQDSLVAEYAEIDRRTERPNNVSKWVEFWVGLSESERRSYKTKVSTFFVQTRARRSALETNEAFNIFLDDYRGFSVWYKERPWREEFVNPAGESFYNSVYQWLSSPIAQRESWQHRFWHLYPGLAGLEGHILTSGKIIRQLARSWLPSSLASGIQEDARPSGRELSNEPFDIGLSSDHLDSDRPSQSLDPEQSMQPESTESHFQLQKLFADSSPEELEAAVRKGVDVLEGLKKPLRSVSSETSESETSQWLQSIENVLKQATHNRTIVGVVGNTGAGKSSVINAMLDEERLVPTNCMRACTAVVTEISYNHEDIPYRAEIEFVTAKDWEKELDILFHDLLDGSGNVSRDASNEDSDAGVAFAKIRAVYPEYSKEMIAESSVRKLMDHKNVRNILGSKREVKNEDSMMFYKKLQTFVDSKEKGGPGRPSSSRDMEYWPLIKVVRLYVKSEALSTGAVIVDLPGVHDSNAARSAVAEGYMKQCSGLWIVAPINRAVDDKAAKSLLGETFKRQLKMDGGFSTVTFICSKTDDISLMEAQDSLGLEEQMTALWAKSDANTNEKRRLKKEMDELKETKEVYSSAIEDAEEQLETWEKLEEDLEEGRVVYDPREGQLSPKKRKRGKKSPKASGKKRRRLDSDDDRDHEESDQDSDQEDSQGAPESQDRGEPLTADQISDKITELKQMKKDGRRERGEIEKKIKEIRVKIAEVDEDEERQQAEMSAICISGRNQYSRKAISQDYAAGIKELDQELAAEEDAANFNPDVEVRDYDEVARSLPVFCVSSRGYQKLKGRFRKDPAVHGFKTVEETEIPQLQSHCKKLTVAGRVENCRRFLNSLSQLLNSLRLWSSNDGTGAHLSAGQKVREAQGLQGRLKKLDSELDKQVKNICQSVLAEINENIIDLFGPAITKAADKAVKTALHWGAPLNRENRALGGYHYMSYKAICRRNGVYSNAQGPHDWNAELVEPIMKEIASGWEKTFSRRAPHIFTTFPTGATRILRTFHTDVETRASRNGGAVASLQMLSHHLQNYRELFKDISTGTATAVTNQSREVNRLFQPIIAVAVGAAYEACDQERGTGSFMRMKGHMNSHIRNVRNEMFRESTKAVKRALKEMVETAEKTMLGRIDEVYLSVKRDYSSVIVGSQSATGVELPREQRIARKEVLDLVIKIGEAFKSREGIGLMDFEDDGLRQEERNLLDCDHVDGPTKVEVEGGGLDIDAHGTPQEGKESSDKEDQDALTDIKPERVTEGGKETTFANVIGDAGSKNEAPSQESVGLPVDHANGMMKPDNSEDCLGSRPGIAAETNPETPTRRDKPFETQITHSDSPVHPPSGAAPDSPEKLSDEEQDHEEDEQDEQDEEDEEDGQNDSDMQDDQEDEDFQSELSAEGEADY